MSQTFLESTLENKTANRQEKLRFFVFREQRFYHTIEILDLRFIL
jgi:hypothetical protein